MNDRFKFRFWDKETQTMQKIPMVELRHRITLDKIFADNRVIFMQCTGLKDKNGKLIYEGDIVRFAEYIIDDVEPEWEYTQIVWGGKYDYPAFDLSKNPFDNNGLSEIFACGWTIEVIGNIYENKELLESEG